MPMTKKVVEGFNHDRGLFLSVLMSIFTEEFREVLGQAKFFTDRITGLPGSREDEITAFRGSALLVHQIGQTPGLLTMENPLGFPGKLTLIVFQHT